MLRIPEEVRDYLSYDPKTGDLTWIKQSSRCKPVGSKVTHIGETGYLQVRFKGKLYKVHSIAWFLYYGEQPPERIDHKDTNKRNNAMENLRATCQSKNGGNVNKRRKCSSKYKGVTKHKDGWMAQITHDYKHEYLGYFKDERDAALAYNEAAVAYWGDYALTNEVD